MYVGSRQSSFYCLVQMYASRRLRMNLKQRHEMKNDAVPIRFKIVGLVARGMTWLL